MTGKGPFRVPVTLCELAADVHRHRVRSSIRPMNHCLLGAGVEGSGLIPFDEEAHLSAACGVLKQDHSEGGVDTVCEKRHGRSVGDTGGGRRREVRMMVEGGEGQGIYTYTSTPFPSPGQDPSSIT